MDDQSNFSIPSRISDQMDPGNLDGFLLARVVEEHRERYVIRSPEGTFSAEITGNLRYTAESRLDFPAVGDWVKAMQVDDESAVILEVLPRFSILQRQAIGQFGERQVIATNIDGAFLVQSGGHDFNLNRLERYLTICHDSGIEPLILLTKTDLMQEDERGEYLGQLKKRMGQVPVIAVSSETKEGYPEILEWMKPGKTYCFLGSSGVGKSTLVNGLAGREVLKTREVSESTAKGKHTTSHRELVILPNGSVVIDTPGMRELGMTDQTAGLEATYDQIHSLAEQCRFNDCTHTSEAGCAVLEAVEAGTLSPDVYENYMKLQREQARFTSTIQEKRAKSKQQGKLYKSIQKAKRWNKFRE